MGTQSNTVTGAMEAAPGIHCKTGDQETRTQTLGAPALGPAAHAAGMGGDRDCSLSDPGAGQGAPLDPIDPFGSFSSRTGGTPGKAQDFGFCAAISDLQLAVNLFMSIPALTQSFIS